MNTSSGSANSSRSSVLAANRAFNLQGRPDVALSDSDDDHAISIGYRMVERYSNGLNRDQYLEFILSQADGETIVRN